MDVEAAPAKLRLEMLRRAIEHESRFTIDDCELHRPPPSFTIETVEDMQRRMRETELFYFIGEDNIAGLTSWHRFNELEKLVQFVVLDRRGFKSSTTYPVIRRHIDISATEIRKRVADGRSIRYLVPDAVAEIIRREELYKESK
jgi:nicotinate-nucleotide adenylyltransferase